LNKGWDIWKKMKRNGHKYILVRISRPFFMEWPCGKREEKILYEFILADPKKTAFVLAKHYDLFKDLTGVDFHPLEIVFELENSDSAFWNQLLFPSSNDKDLIKSYRALGLLFGFGDENSLLFSWREEAKKKGGKMAEFFSNTNDLAHQTQSGWASIDAWVNSLKIPDYISFDEGRRKTEYEQERKKIQKLYRNGNFLEAILNEMCK